VLGVAPFLKQPLLSQHSQPPGQDRRCDANAFPELVKAREAGMGIPQDQYAPRVAGNSQATHYGARVIASIFIVHTILIVTRFRNDSNITLELIVTV
jgi:hypothetical protein